ncbi:MAG: RNA methyltransferase [Chloroflexota bacterium]|nr:RNA methyltransferase [Chloroflexota bacterium]
MRLVQEALSSGLQISPLLFSPARLSGTPAGRALRHRLDHLPQAEEIDDALLASISDTVTCQGVVAAGAIPRTSVLPDGGLVLILDGIADPGNAGSIVRTARAAGAAAIVAMKGTTDLWAPKAVRAGMGAHFHVPMMADVSWSDLEAAIGSRQVVLAATFGGVPYWQLDWRQPAALVVGAEAHGASPQAEARAQARVTIPMAEGAESLNAAAAAAVLLFEARKQRVDRPRPAAGT